MSGSKAASTDGAAWSGGVSPRGGAELGARTGGPAPLDSLGAADPFAAMSQALTPKRAVSYIRVSTREQAQRGGTEEGFSIPAQRAANKRKAASVGALIVKEFVDRGESARSANRPALQQMLAYLQESNGVQATSGRATGRRGVSATQAGAPTSTGAGDGATTPLEPIDYVIVHKLDRLARNRADDVEINRVLDEAGVRLISTSENIDQTPGGMLLHGIMSSIAEFYSRNLANEVIKGMSEKARSGGTLGKAPLGYRNTRSRDAQGREIRTVELDPERAPLMRLAFTEYATGQWTVRTLADHLSGLGLTVPATPSKPAKPITANRLHTLLRHPYYKGIVTFQGVEYPGQHEALVSAETWQTVQDILVSHRNGERERIHTHFLRSAVVCGQCGARLLVQNAKNRSGTVYPYFVCARRHRSHDCAFRAVLIEQVEARVTDVYRTICLSSQDRALVEQYLLEELAQIEARSAHDVRSLTVRRTNVEDQRRQLLQAHYAGAIPLDLLKDEQDRLSRELRGIERTLTGYQADASLVRQHLSQALDLLEDASRLYTAAPDHLKKQLNQVFFDHILVNPLIDEDGRVVLPGDGASGISEQAKDNDETLTTVGLTARPSSAAGGVGDSSSAAPTGSTPPILVRDSHSHTSAAVVLAFPFNELSGLRLLTVARQAAQGWSGDEQADEPKRRTKPGTKRRTASSAGTSDLSSCSAPSASATSAFSSSPRTTPTRVGERDSFEESTEGSFCGAGSYKSTVVREKGLEPSHPKAPEPKSGASTSSATRARHPSLPAARMSLGSWRAPTRPPPPPARSRPSAAATPPGRGPSSTPAPARARASPSAPTAPTGSWSPTAPAAGPGPGGGGFRPPGRALPARPGGAPARARGGRGMRTSPARRARRGRRSARARRPRAAGRSCSSYASSFFSLTSWPADGPLCAGRSAGGSCGPACGGLRGRIARVRTAPGCDPSPAGGHRCCRALAVGQRKENPGSA